VARSVGKAKSRSAALKDSVPWAELAQGGIAIGSRWRRLSRKERDRLLRLARESRGRLTTLTAKERKELRSLIAKLDLLGLARELDGLRASWRKRRPGGRRRRLR
jgi:hypothetical protein